MCVKDPLVSSQLQSFPKTLVTHQNPMMQSNMAADIQAKNFWLPLHLRYYRLSCLCFLLRKRKFVLKWLKEGLWGFCIKVLKLNWLNFPLRSRYVWWCVTNFLWYFPSSAAWLYKTDGYNKLFDKIADIYIWSTPMLIKSFHSVIRFRT